MAHSQLTNGVQITSDSSPRSSRIDRFIVHHAATTSLAAILSLFQPGGRTVSANYALGNDGTLVLAVDESRRAWTSSSAEWDGRAVTIEVANSMAGGSWPVSDASFDKLARLIADVSIRYGFPLNDNTVLTHQELYQRYGASYATACPGDLQRRKAELIGRANYYRAFGSGTAGDTPEAIQPPKQEDNVIIYYASSNSTDGVIRNGTSYISDGGPLRPLSRAEFDAYNYYSPGFKADGGKSQSALGYIVPVRWAKWTGQAIRDANRYLGVMEQTGNATGDVPILSGRVIYEDPAKPVFPRVSVA
jgi:hypothetical protein